MRNSGDLPPRPSQKIYTWMIEMYADMPKPDHTEVANWLGIPRVIAEWAWKKGWPGDKKRGNGALLPIKDVVSRMRFSASAMAEDLERAVTLEGEKELVAAIKDGTVKRAMENLVQRGMLKMIQANVDNSIAIQAAAQMLVERLLSQISTMADVRKLSMQDIKAELTWVLGYQRETVLLAERYAAIDKVREASKPIKPEDQNKLNLTDKTESELYRELADSITAVREALGNKDIVQSIRASSTKVIDVEGTPVAAKRVEEED